MDKTSGRLIAVQPSGVLDAIAQVLLLADVWVGPIPIIRSVVVLFVAAEIIW